MVENDDEEDDLQARELRFEMGYREIEMFDKQKEIKSQPPCDTDSHRIAVPLVRE